MEPTMGDAPVSPDDLGVLKTREATDDQEQIAKRPRLAEGLSDGATPVREAFVVGLNGEAPGNVNEAPGRETCEATHDLEADLPPPQAPLAEDSQDTIRTAPETLQDTQEEEDDEEPDDDEDEEEGGVELGPMPLPRLRGGCNGGTATSPRMSLRRNRRQPQRRRSQLNGIGGARPLDSGASSPSGAASRVNGSAAACSTPLVPAAASQWTWDKLPPPRDHELEFFLSDPRSYRQGKSVLSHCVSLQGGAFRFRLLVFPMGTESTQKPEQLAAFVEVLPPADNQAARWAFEGVKYQISVVHWKDYRKSVTQSDTYTFRWDSADRGWHRGFLKATDMTLDSGWFGEDGQLCLRASCSARRAMIQVPAAGGMVVAGRRAAGYVGLKNHGATCYMNCLLQTLFHIGRFREIVYSIDAPELCAGSPDSFGSQVAALSEDDAVDGGCGLAADERPPLPLLVALQNLFYRLQTSDVPVSCRELMRSFGWDTADAFMQHDAQELNRLLCDRLEEQMKGTTMDGAIKRLFEGEIENYIDCVDIDYRSVRIETFYDLQLNVRNDEGDELTSLEDSLRNFTSEEVLDGENAYDAGAHGKQRARKGIKFKRFPPVLYIQLKRFMFDVERMDMCKINGRLNFPLNLDLEAMAPGSGTYSLHTVVVHSGGVSSGHYYAFVRVRDGENGGSRWVKFDDDQVTPCIEQAAVEENYGGDDPVIWNYFQLSPRQLAERSFPTAQRIHNAYMLSYVRTSLVDEILASPNLDDGKDAYRRLVDRCTREARLAEERRLARVEQLLRVEVRMLLERDLMRLEGFWSHHALPYSHHFRMSRDQLAEDLWREAETRLDVPNNQLVLFLLHLRKTRQTRFKFLPPNQVLRAHLPPHGAPHSSTCDPPHLVVLCVCSRGLDPQTFDWQLPDPPASVPLRWNDEVCLLIVKYFCLVTSRLVTLGCYYCHTQNTLDCMLSGDTPWLERRLKQFADRKEVASLPEGVCARDGAFLCWEEYQHKSPKDIIERDPRGTIEKEGLFNGDVIVWQLTPAAQESPDINAGGVSYDDQLQVLTVKDLAASILSQVPVTVQLHRADAPLCPEGVTADGVWVKNPEPAPGVALLGQQASEDNVPTQEADLEASGGAPRVLAGGTEAPAGVEGVQSDQYDLTADCRWRVGSFVVRVAKAFGLEAAVRNGSGDMWLFAHGPPSFIDEPPSFLLDDNALALENGCAGASGSRARCLLAELLPRAAATAAQRLLFHAILVPRSPQPRTRPVVVHFFSSAVVEVGALVLHLSDAGSRADAEATAEDLDPSDSGAEAVSTTGRVGVDAREVLALAMRHLESPAGNELLPKLAPAAGRRQAPYSEQRLPLRLVDVARGRIRAVWRGGDDTDTTAATGEAADVVASPASPERRPRWVWPARGKNLLAAGLRVEPDCESDDDAVGDTDSLSLRDGDSQDSKAGFPNADAQAQTQLVEVFHTEQSGHAFGHPFLLRVAKGESARSVALRVQAKLRVPDVELRQWRLLVVDGAMRSALDEVGWSASAPALCLERHHPSRASRSPTAGRQLRQRPLTIAAR